MSADVRTIKEAAEKKMEGAISSLDREFQTLRTGRAVPSILDSVKVEAYGSEMPINQMANVSSPDPRTLQVTPWDKGQLGAIERAITASTLLKPTFESTTRSASDGKAEMVNAPSQFRSRSRLAG